MALSRELYKYTRIGLTPGGDANLRCEHRSPDREFAAEKNGATMAPR